MKEIRFALELQSDNLKVICSLLKNPVTENGDNQGEVTFTFNPKMRPCTKHIAIKYHHSHNLVAKGDVFIEHIETKEKSRI